MIFWYFILIYNLTNKKNILYGSPLFSPPNIIQNLNNEREINLIKNICILFINFFYNKDFTCDDNFNIILDEISSDFSDKSIYYKIISDILLGKKKISFEQLCYLLTKIKKNKKNIFKLLSDDIFLMDL